MNINTENKIKELVLKNSTLKISIEDINNESNLISDFGYDSITIIQCIIEIEKEFKFDFEDEHLNIELFTKFQNLINYVDNRINV